MHFRFQCAISFFNSIQGYLDSASQLETGSTFQYNVMGAFCDGCHAHHPAMVGCN